jgi:hypothetical protein
VWYASSRSGGGHRPRRRTPRPAAALTPGPVPRGQNLSGHDWPAGTRTHAYSYSYSFAHAKAVFTLTPCVDIAEPAGRPGTPFLFFSPLRRTRLQRRSSSLRLATRVAAWGVGELFSFRVAAGRARACQRHARTGRRAGGRSVRASARGFPNHPLFPLSSRHLRATAGRPAGAVGRGDNYVQFGALLRTYTTSGIGEDIDWIAFWL